MTAVHAQLAAGRWSELSFAEQMGHVGSADEIWQRYFDQFALLARRRALEPDRT